MPITLPTALGTIIAVILIIIMATWSYRSYASPNGLPVVTVEEARALQQQGVQLVDVRTQFEWNKGRASGAIHAPVGRVVDVVDEQIKDRDQALLTYCVVGARAARAAKKLTAAGYSNVYILQPQGYRDWAEAGYPIQK